MDKPLRNLELWEVQQICASHKICWGCPLRKDCGGCVVGGNPQESTPAGWDLREKEERHG